MKTTFDAQTIEINPSNDGYVAMLENKNIFIKVIHVENGRFKNRQSSIENRNETNPFSS